MSRAKRMSNTKMKLKVRLINYKKLYPNLQGGKAFSRWFWYDTFYAGKMIHINIKHYALEFDFR